MSSLVNEILRAFNTLVDEQRELKNAKGQGAALSLMLFNTVQLLYDALPIDEVPSLTRELYQPDGGTALNDAIAAMIQVIGKRTRHGVRVLVAILTDGEENVSRKFSLSDIHHMITYRQSLYDWQFIFIGPEEAKHYALSLGIPKSNVVSLRADSAGIAAIMSRLSSSIKAYQLGDSRYALKLQGS
jgi:hypothetical protein